MKVHIIAVGKITDPSIRALCDEYARRLGRWLRVSVHELRSPRAGGERAARLRAEGDRVLQGLPAGARVVALTRAGRAESSEDFARRVEGWKRDARDVALVIGGPFGLDQRVLDCAETRLSLSAMTLPHELARVVLLEQLYRAATILAGTPYHKGGRT